MSFFLPKRVRYISLFLQFSSVGLYTHFANSEEAFRIRLLDSIPFSIAEEGYKTKDKFNSRAPR